MSKSIRSRCQQMLSRDQRGETLTYALLVLTFGVLLISPVLGHLGTNLKAAQSSQALLNRQYCSDAGVEFGLWRLEHDAALVETLVHSVGTPQTLADVPASMNGGAPTLQVVCVLYEEQVAPSATPDQTPTPSNAGTATNTPVTAPTETETLAPSATPTLTLSPTPTRIGGGGQARLQWVIWANSSSVKNALTITGASKHIVGNVHSNSSIRIAGSGTVISGRVEYAGDAPTIQGSGHVFIPDTDNPVQALAGPYPISWKLEDFQPGGVYANAASAAHQYYPHSGKWNAPDDVIPPGLHYCTGDVKISGSGVVGHNVTVVALGKISISGSGMDFSPYIDGLSFFSYESKGTALDMSISGNAWGTMFAPNGLLSLSGSGECAGALIADEVDISGSGFSFNLAEIYVPDSVVATPSAVHTSTPAATATQTPVSAPTATFTPDAPTITPSTLRCPEFDLRCYCLSVDAGVTITTVRVRACPGEALEVLSWQVR